MNWTTRAMPDQTGRVAVVTGANGGLGLETARELARKGAHVVMAARNLAKAEAARASIVADVGDASLEVRELDLASLDSVHAAADAILDAHPQIDLLVNNAGIMAVPEGRTDDGFERQLGVNHLGHFVLTCRLLPALLDSSHAARIVTVTSTARLGGSPVDPANPHLDAGYEPWRAYARSKLANLQFAVELQRRLEQSGAPLSSLAAHPGLSQTDLQSNTVRSNEGGVVPRFFEWLAGAVGMPPARGALPQLRAATDPRAQGGQMFGPRWGSNGPPVPRPLLGRSLQREPAERLWRLSERETGVTFDVAAMVADHAAGRSALPDESP